MRGYPRKNESATSYFALHLAMKILRMNGIKTELKRELKTLVYGSLTTNTIESG